MPRIQWDFNPHCSYGYSTLRKPLPFKNEKGKVASPESLLTLKVSDSKIVEFANSVDLDGVAHYEPPHLDLHCLPSSL